MKDVLKFMKQFLFIFFVVVNLSACYAQVAVDHGHVENPAFDAKLEKLLSFTVPTVDVKQLKTMEGAVIADARELNEYQISHIPGAEYVGYKDFSADRLEGVSKDTPIVLYCSVGYRSEKIGEKLQKAGYTNVYNLYGSIFEWVNEGNPVVDALNNPTKKVHTYNEKWSQWLEDGKAEEVW